MDFTTLPRMIIQALLQDKLVTNKRITIDVDGDDETYYFDKTGKAYTMKGYQRLYLWRRWQVNYQVR